MSPNGVYLYGFIPRLDSLNLEQELSEIAGVESSHPARTLELDVASAVVGDVRLGRFQAAMSSGLDGKPDPDWIIPQALRHEAVLDTLLTKTPVLPARFGTLFSSSEALRCLVQQHQQSILQYFDLVGDRQEWAIKGYLDIESAAAAVLNRDPELSTRQQKLPQTPGTRYFLEKKLNEEARRLARRAALRETERTRQLLRSQTPDVRSIPLQASEGGSEMLLHEVFLFSPRHLPDLEPLLSSQPNASLMRLEITGPWPPFHFCPSLGGSDA